MKVLFQKYRTFFFLNIYLLSVYFLVISNVKYDISEETMFFAPDAQQYLNTSTEFYDFSEQGNSLTRPFFYPLLILLTYQTFGVFGLWFLHLVCWILSINILFLAVRKMVSSKIIPYAVVFLLSINFSLIVFTLNGLTEIITVFLLSVLIHRLANGALKDKNGSVIVLLLMALLTVTRPVFFYPFIGYFIFHVYRFLFRDRLDFRRILFVFIAVAPVLFQLTLMKVKYDKLKVSDIDSITLTDYLLAQTVRLNEPGIEYEASIIKARGITDKQDFLWENKSGIMRLFIQNINESLEGYPSLFFIKEFEQEGLGNKMAVMNQVYYWLHFIFFAPVLFFIFGCTKDGKGKREIIVFLYLIFSYVVFTCGISFFQGDRFLIAMLPVWLFIYSIVAEAMIRHFRFKNN